MPAATNIPISATTTDYVGAINAAIAATGNFDRAINQQLITSFRALDRETRVYEQGLGRVARIIETQAADAARAAAQVAAAAAQTIAAQAQRVQNIGNGFRSVGSALTTYLTAPLALASGAAFNAYAQIDGMVKGLTAATGSAQEANKQFKEFYEISKKPGLGLEQTVAAGLQLETLGYQAKTAQKYVAEVGNAIALGGKGKVEFGSVMTQFTQMAGKAKVLSEDLKPIVTASPVIAKAINNIFGSVDSETISSKLQAAGKGPKDFIEMLVNELSKVERVEAGPKNALENIGDAAAIASYNIAGAADKIFDITGKINAISDFISKAAEKFAQLSPTAQGSILGLVGLAGATGPLALGIGSVIKLIPIFKLGLGAIGGTVGLVAIGVVAAAALIIANWDAIKKTLVDTGIWHTAANAISAGLEAGKAYLTKFKDVVLAIWGKIKDFVIPTVVFIFDAVAAIFRVGFGVLGGIFKVITGTLTGNWSKFSEGMQNVTVSLFNGITSLFTAGFKAVLGFSSAMLKAVHMDDAAKGLDTYAASLHAIMIPLKGVAAEAKKTAAAIELPEVVIKGKRTPGPFNGNVPGSSGKAVKEKDDKFYSELNLNKRIAERLEREIQDANGVGVEDKIAQLAALRREIERLEALTSKNQKINITGINDIVNPNAVLQLSAILTNAKQAAQLMPGIFAKTGLNDFLTDLEKARPSLDFVQNKIEEIKATIAGLKLNGKVVPPELIQQLKDLKKLMADSMNATGAADAMTDTGEGNDSKWVEKAQKRIDAMRAAGKAVNVSAVELGGQMKEAAVQFAQAGFSALESIGTALGNGADPLKAALQSITDALGNYLIKQGEALAMAALFEQAAAVAAGPFAPLLALPVGFQLAAAGVMIGGGAAIKNLGKHAKGGVFDEPSIGLFGEYAGAGMNREIATPERLMASTFLNVLRAHDLQQSVMKQSPYPDLSSMRGSDLAASRLRSSGGSSNQTQTIHLTGEFGLRGQDLSLAIKRYQRSQESYT